MPWRTIGNPIFQRDAAIPGACTLLPSIYQVFFHHCPPNVKPNDSTSKWWVSVGLNGGRSFWVPQKIPDIRAYNHLSRLHKEILNLYNTSDYGRGAVLSQMHEGKDQPIAYASRHLNKAEVKYSTIEKEAAAVIFWKNFSATICKTNLRHRQQPLAVTVAQKFKDETERLWRTEVPPRQSIWQCGFPVTNPNQLFQTAPKDRGHRVPKTAKRSPLQRHKKLPGGQDTKWK